MKLFCFFILYFSVITGQKKYPADSLIKSPDTPLFSKIGLIPIAGWQRISYNTNLFNCQFYPSCSNYGATAVKKYGLLKGGIITSERITRCNPYAFRYHLKQKRPFNDKDGRLIDPVIQESSSFSNKSPLFAALISSIIPGSGRMYGGRKLDGISGLCTFLLYSITAQNSLKNGQKIAAPILTSLCLFVYFGEIYGGWRTVKYYQTKNTVEKTNI